MVGKEGNFCDSIPIARDMGYSTIQATVITIRELFLQALQFFKFQRKGCYLEKKAGRGKENTKKKKNIYIYIYVYMYIKRHSLKPENWKLFLMFLQTLVTLSTWYSPLPQ